MAIITSKLLDTRSWVPKSALRISGSLFALYRGFLLFIPNLKLKSLVACELLEPAGTEFDELWNSCSAGGVSVVKDSCWLGWRYQCHPDVAYRIFTLRSSERLEGWVVIKTHVSPLGEAITICDWLYRTGDDVWIAFIFKILGGVQYNEKVVKLWISNSSRLRRRLSMLLAVTTGEVSLIFKPLCAKSTTIVSPYGFSEFLIGDSDNA
jgi:hypothetical protein